ncbi:MAG: alpha-L-fucosidase [Verrucomicrobiota bacterium]|nr:alpha-L-fucosidase [Verrucomicrobiota bacterium]
MIKYFLIYLLISLTVNNASSELLSWEKFSDHEEAPKWFRDAKFGIYFHWGPYSVPAYGNEHYPRTMYGHPSGKMPVKSASKRNYNLGVGFQSFREHLFHIDNYGDPEDFEYHHFIPLFRGDEFNAEEWAQLFYLSGARFAGPVAEHHDGYAMWDSDVTPWNAKDTGPCRDIVGELADSIRKKGLKFITTFHHARMGKAPSESNERDKRKWYYYGREKYFDRNIPTYKDSEELSKLYGSISWDHFLQIWNKKLEEVIEKYRPDLIWFDSWLDRIPQKNRIEFVNTYLKAAKQWKKPVVITYKQNDLPQKVGIVDFEKGRLDRLTEYAWLTDDTISAGVWTETGSWSYTEELDIKSSREIIHTLVDIVSKNGNLLLNISPRADGSIPLEQRHSLLGVGDWLKVNGEAIYETRPFKIYGEGPKRMASSGHFVQMDSEYDAENLRFTTKDNNLYVIQMGWLGSHKEFTVNCLNHDNLANTQIKEISVIGSDESIRWERSNEGLKIRTPFKAPNKSAVVFKIDTNDLGLIVLDDEAEVMAPITVDG